MDVVLAADIGGTSTRLLVKAAADNRELVRRTLPAHPGNYALAQREFIQAGRLLAGNNRLVAVGMGVAGVIADGIFTGSGNLHDWVGRPVQADLQNAFQVPAAVLNDAQAAGLGEYAALGQPTVYVIWGTGVGVAIVVDGNGRILALATELGHVVIDKKSRLVCGCGGRGHLEAHVSGSNIPKRRFGLRRGLKAEHLTDRQWNAVLRDMAVGLRSITAAAPGLPIVMGGGISNKQSHRLPVLQEMVAKLPSSCPAPALHLAKHGEDSGLMGAAYAAQQLVAA